MNACSWKQTLAALLALALLVAPWMASAVPPVPAPVTPASPAPMADVPQAQQQAQQLQALQARIQKAKDIVSGLGGEK